VKVRELLSSPFVLQVYNHQLADGSWETVVGYPELGVAIRGTDVVEMLETVEVARVRSLVERIEKGNAPVPRRQPLGDFGVDRLLVSAGREDWVERLDEVVE
jgi:hypothetical protein